MAASNFAKGMVIGLQVGADSAKPPVLTELTVTENGVYDKPVISNGPEPIIWDGNTDGKTFISVESTFFVKMSDEIFSVEDFAGYAVTMNDGHVFDTEDQVYALPGAVVIGEMAVISVQDKDAFFAATEILNFPENGTYFASNTETGFYTVSLTFPTSSTPADGWNKVTVNVPTGAELNIAYGDTPPEDTTKLWVKTERASAVKIAGETLTGDSLRPASVASVASGGYSTYYPMMAMVDGKVYIFGGGLSGDKNTIKVFDPYTKVVTTLSETLPSVLSRAGCGAVGKNIFLFGGDQGGSAQVTLYMFDTVEQKVTDLSSVYTDHIGIRKPLKNISCATIGDIIYLFGGIGANTGAINNEIYKFDGVNKKFLGSGVTLSGLTSNLCICSAVGEKIYAFSGDDSGNIWEYDIHSQVVRVLTKRMPQYTRGANCCTIDGKVYFVGVSDVSLTNKIYCFDPSTEEISEVYASSSNIRYGFGIVPFEHGAYYFGGNNGNIWNFLAPIDHMPLERGHLKIVPVNGVNSCQLINTDTMKLAIGVNEIYMGDENNEGQPVEAAVYQYGAWQTI